MGGNDGSGIDVGTGAEASIVVDDGSSGKKGSLANNGVGLDNSSRKHKRAGANLGGRADRGREVRKGRNWEGKGFKTVKKLLPERKIAEADRHGGIAEDKIGEIGNGSDGERKAVINKVYTGISASLD